MEEKENWIKENLKIEEELRIKIYSIIDSRGNTLSKKEFTIYDNILKQLERLAGYYKKKGFKIWIH
jgi:hypothetical protein